MKGSDKNTMNASNDNFIKVNGKQYFFSEIQGEMTLLQYLREYLFLTSVKNGCGIGVCGTCSVVLNGKVIKSCKTSVSKAAGGELVTTEGMELPGGVLHPIQQAFVDSGAIQCGFCTPGMVMRAYGLLLENASPGREDIRKAFAGNLCRCTGYQQIIDAVELSARMIRDGEPVLTPGCMI